MVWNTPLVCLGHLACLCTLPRSCPPLSLLLGVGMLEKYSFGVVLAVEQKLPLFSSSALE